jgi:hypothetical protein
VTPFWRFVHYLALTAWIGGALSAMIAGLALRRLDRSLWVGVAEAQAAIYRALIGPGAMVTVFTGLMLTFRMYGSMSVQVGPWLGSMQGLGLIAALVTLLGAMPAATRMARLEPTGATAAAFDQARRRLAITGSVGGALALLALLAGALYRP